MMQRQFLWLTSSFFGEIFSFPKPKMQRTKMFELSYRKKYWAMPKLKWSYVQTGKMVRQIFNPLVPDVH